MWTPTAIFPDSFVKIWLDLTDILLIFFCFFAFCLLFFCSLVCLNYLGISTGHFPKIFLTIVLDLAHILLISKGVCLHVCLFILIILGYPQEYTLQIPWRSDLIWLRYIGSKNVYLFVCLFVSLFFCSFSFESSLDTPRKIS